MSEPTTEAGRKMWREVRSCLGYGTEHVNGPAILAIEAEARAPLEADLARLRRIEEAARAVCDIYAHFEDCYPIGPCTCGLDALRAALEDR